MQKLGEFFIQPIYAISIQNKQIHQPLPHFSILNFFKIDLEEDREVFVFRSCNFLAKLNSSRNYFLVAVVEEFIADEFGPPFCSFIVLVEVEFDNLDSEKD